MQVTAVESDAPAFPAALRGGDCARLWTLGGGPIPDAPLLALFCSQRCPGEIVLQACDFAAALRGAGVAVIGGFHSTVEKKCLELLLRGGAPVVVCPARGLAGMRVPAAWRKPLDEGRLTLVSPFEPRRRRADARAAAHRNRFAAALAARLLALHAAPQSGLERLCAEALAAGKEVYTPDCPQNAALAARGALPVTAQSLLERVAGGQLKMPL